MKDNDDSQPRELWHRIKPFPLMQRTVLFRARYIEHNRFYFSISCMTTDHLPVITLLINEFVRLNFSRFILSQYSEIIISHHNFTNDIGRKEKAAI